MPEPLIRLVLLVEERRGEEDPVPVTRVEWGAEDLPNRAYFVSAIKLAYGSIELPYFPHAAWVEASTATRSMRMRAAEPEDEALVGAALWGMVVAFASGYA